MVDALVGYAVLCVLWGVMFVGIMKVTNIICGDYEEFKKNNNF